MNKYRKITAILVAKPGKMVELELLLKTMAAPSRAESGNLRWDVWQDQDDPNRFVLDELYENEAAVVTHRSSAHFRNYVAVIGDVAERIAVVSTPLDLAFRD